MRHLLSIATIPVLCASLAAQSTGRIQGKVTTKAGKPIADATIKIKRLDISWAKETKTKSNGSYMQVGLEPKEFEVEASAEGYVSSKAIQRIPIGDSLTQDFTLLTPAEAQEEMLKSGTGQAGGAKEESAGSAAFNEAVTLYNAQQFDKALPLIETAYKSLKESVDKTKDEKAKADLESKILKVERVYGIVLFEVGKTDETRKADLWKQADPLLTAALARVAPEDTGGQLRLLKPLRDIAADKKDAQTEQKYQAVIDKLEPPSATGDYNKAVDAFNSGQNADAKAYLETAIKKDPKFADSYYLLGMVEYGNNNLKATKAAFLKYLEAAPNGKKADEVKAMLDDPSLKKIK